MRVRSSTRVICRTRKVRVITMTRTQWEILKRLSISIKDYCKQPEIRRGAQVRYKFGGR